MSVRRNVGKTWRVNSDTPVTQPETMDGSSWDQSALDNPATVALMQIAAEEEARLLREEQESISLSNELEHDEKTDWLRSCYWPRWFAHKPLHLIIATSRVPLAARLFTSAPGTAWSGSAAQRQKRNLYSY
jgi:hypothetical protein